MGEGGEGERGSEGREERERRERERERVKSCLKQMTKPRAIYRDLSRESSQEEHRIPICNPQFYFESCVFFAPRHTFFQNPSPNQG